MTVNTVSPAIISRAEFNRNAGQTKTPQLVRMDFTNLVTNGGFDTDIVGWTDVSEGTGSVAWNASGYIDLTTGVSSSNEGRVEQVAKTVIGGYYTGSIGRISGTSMLTFGDRTLQGNLATTGTAASASSETLTFTASVINTYVGLRNFTTLSATSTVDNITLYEADPSDDAPWLRLPYGYSVGRTGWIVRDGVVLHPSDYTEVKDSGQTWIKPLVAPGASTEFSIWGSTA